MPSLHGLTGCDYTAVFYRKGKVVPLKKVLSFEFAQERLKNLRRNEFSDELVSSLEKFVCSLYSTTFITVNDVRTNMFLNKYKAEKNKPLINYAKNLDATSLPQCHRTLIEKLRRV